MQTKVMITLMYSRIPKTTVYEMKLDVDKVAVLGDANVRELPILSYYAPEVEMGDMLESLSGILQRYPDATVTMIGTSHQPQMYGEMRPKGQQLDDAVRDLIRDNLEDAKKMFAPVDRTVRARDKEDDHGER